MKKLVVFDDEPFGSGKVFCVPGGVRDADILCLILVDLTAFSIGMAVVEATGYNAGFVRHVLPPESYYQDTKKVSARWLQENWVEVIYDECSVEDVVVVHRLEPPDIEAVSKG